MQKSEYAYLYSLTLSEATIFVYKFTDIEKSLLQIQLNSLKA